MLRSGSDTLMVSSHHNDQPNSRSTTVIAKPSKSCENTSKTSTRNVTTQSSANSNNTGGDGSINNATSSPRSSSTPSSSSSSGASGIGSAVPSGKVVNAKSKSNGTSANAKSNGSNSSGKETNPDETCITATQSSLKSRSTSFSNMSTPPLKRTKVSDLPENNNEIMSISYNTSARVHHNIYPVLGNIPHSTQPPQTATTSYPQHQQHAPPHQKSHPSRSNYEQSHLYYDKSATHNRPNEDSTYVHYPQHYYNGNHSEENYGAAYSGYASGTAFRKMPNEPEYHYHNYSKPPPIRFCVCFNQGQYCSSCHIVHMIMHKYNFPCGSRNCEFGETLVHGYNNPQNDQPAYNHQQPPEYTGNPQQPAHQSNNYLPTQQPSFTSNPNDNYYNYSHENYHTDQSKMSH